MSDDLNGAMVFIKTFGGYLVAGAAGLIGFGAWKARFAAMERKIKDMGDEIKDLRQEVREAVEQSAERIEATNREVLRRNEEVNKLITSLALDLATTTAHLQHLMKGK